ncbi:unnamed protein product [Rotaria socialis]|uniref:Uncharacterized protein n=1 Tax=Rotaria socialis TaxID=392032 RepID=A0A821VGA2_9BILA|nr:unnamed protein product [Rotaria socialis]CAF4908208.1 unnamed protein product [Rotaria socialis]
MKDSYPLPHMEETINQPGGSSYFSKMDLKSGYFQLPIDEKDKPKAAFTTSRGLWEFNVLPQGLKNAPPSFQRVLNNLLATGRRQFCLIYSDDIIIFSKSFHDHCTHLNNVLSVLNQANFQFNPPKCAFVPSEIDYLGHTINAKGFKPLNTNINAIVQVPNPRAAKQVYSFLQMANFYRKFTHNFTELTRPLRAFQKNNMKFYWVTKLRDYLADESFIIETDQQPARNIHLNRSSTNRKVNNWKLQLQDYDIIEIKHKPGTRNCDAGYMSRHPLINNEETNDELDDIPATTSSNTSWTFWEEKTWKRLNDRCSWPTIRQGVIHYIQSCTACAHYNIRREKPPGQIQLIEPPGEVFDLVQKDFTGPLPQSINGNLYVIALPVYLSKYVISKAVPNDSTQTAAEFLIDMTLEFDPPRQLQTDRGSHFASAIFEAVANRLGCVHTVSTPYHPKSQAVIERFNAKFKQQLSKYTNEHYDDWDVYINTIVSSYNSSIHQIIQFPTFQNFHKRKPTSIFDPIKKQGTIPRANDYWNHFLRFEKVYMDQVNKNIRQQQQYSKRRYDRNRPNIQCMIGQKLFIIKPGMYPAFKELYEGPYTIIKQLGSQTFDVIDVHDNMKRVHSSQMKYFHERE